MERKKSTANGEMLAQSCAPTSERSIIADESSFPDLESVARRLMAEGEYEEALPYLQKLIAMNPSYAPAFCHLGQVYYSRMMWREAEEYFRRALSLDFELLEAHFNLAVLYQRQRRFHEALAFFKQVVMSNPGDWECFFRMGQCTAEMGNFTDAEAFYAEALRLKPDSVEAAGGLAQVYIATQQLDKAVETLEQGLSHHPECVELRAALAYVYQQDGEYEKALAQFYRLVKQRPEEAQFYYQLALCCIELGLLREAEPLLAKASQLDPEFLEAVEALGDLYLRTGRDHEAIQAFEHWLQVEASLMSLGVAIQRVERARILRALSACYLRTSNQLRARQLLQESLALVPEQPEAKELLSRLDANAEVLKSP